MLHNRMMVVVKVVKAMCFYSTMYLLGGDLKHFLPPCRKVSGPQDILRWVILSFLLDLPTLYKILACELSQRVQNIYSGPEHRFCGFSTFLGVGKIRFQISLSEGGNWIYTSHILDNFPNRGLLNLKGHCHHFCSFIHCVLLFIFLPPSNPFREFQLSLRISGK